ncbi:MAG: glutamine--tRNA ligase/YqeY domain fusion protein [Planctomycetota bacterium]
MTAPSEPTRPDDFIREAVKADLAAGRFTRVHTRFPPEPNGFLHIGHAKALHISCGIATEFGGRYNLRFDDTDPTKEEAAYVEAIKRDIRWLGFDWEDRLFFASDYFEQLYEWAVLLIGKGRAFVCDQTEAEVKANRGTQAFDATGHRITPAGTNSPCRDRTVAENLDLFARMRAGEFPDGSKTLRAKVDMAHPNLNMRDPVMYRIVRAAHYRQGNAWCIYPTYDWTHGQSDSIECITHSLCSTEFENHRPLYDWYLENLGIYRPRQIEFARLNLTYTVVGKRYLRPLVEDGTVGGWDDPRMPTLGGLRRRGYTPAAIAEFCRRIGIAKTESTVGIELLEHCQREELNRTAPRRMAVLRPLKVIITNFPEGAVEQMEMVNNPEDPAAGIRAVPFGRELWIERDDFMEDPPKGFFRLAPGREVRLRSAFFITCTAVVKDARGAVTELHCTYDPATRGGDSPDGRKVKGTLHWVAAAHAVAAEVRLYDRLFTVPDPREGTGEEWRRHINPASLQTVTAMVEPSLKDAEAGFRCQFERRGYFCADPDTRPGKPVFNLTVPLKDSWKKAQAKPGAEG